MIDPNTFWMYSLAAISLMWGALGLRFALSMAVANGITAFILFYLENSIGRNNLLYGLVLCYPLFLVAAFALFSAADSDKIPSLRIELRLFASLLIILALLVTGNWEVLSAYTRVTYMVYLDEPARRAENLKAFFTNASYIQVCEISYETPFRLAVEAENDKEANVYLEAFSQCPNASPSITGAIKPLFDAGNSERIGFLLRNGLKPTTLIHGSPFLDGAALVYAMETLNNPVLARMIARSDPEDVKNLRVLVPLLIRLKREKNAQMLEILQEAGIQ